VTSPAPLTCLRCAPYGFYTLCTDMVLLVGRLEGVRHRCWVVLYVASPIPRDTELVRQEILQHEVSR